MFRCPQNSEVNSVMTAQEKQHIIDLRSEGLSYQAIADATGISLGSIKMFVKRSKESASPVLSRCEQCRKPLRQDIVRARRRFCCDACRVRWWSAHPDQIQGHSYKCRRCGKEFHSRKPGKYCSRACFYASRKGGARA